jgi:hypothetical protein
MIAVYSTYQVFLILINLSLGKLDEDGLLVIKFSPNVTVPNNYSSLINSLLQIRVVNKEDVRDCLSHFNIEFSNIL